MYYRKYMWIRRGNNGQRYLGMDINPLAPTTPYTRDLLYWNFGLRFTHCIGSSKIFYYGICPGITFFDYVYIPHKENTYDDLFLSIQLVVGARLSFSKNIAFHLEVNPLECYNLNSYAAFFGSYSVEGGISIRINCNKKKRI